MMLPFIVEMEQTDDYELPQHRLLVFAYSKSDAMFNAGAQAALLGCTDSIGLSSTSIKQNHVSFVCAVGLEANCWDISGDRFWDILEEETSDEFGEHLEWGELLATFADSFPHDAWSFKKIGELMNFRNEFKNNPAFAAFVAAVEAYEIAQELSEKPPAQRKSRSI